MQEYGLFAAAGTVLLLALAVLWLAWRIGRLEREGAARFDESLRAVSAEQHRAMLSDLHTAFGQQTDRLGARAEHDAGRLREAMQALHLALQSRLDGQREDVALRFADLSAGVAAAHERLRGELLEQTLKTLSDHARADRELLQEGLRSASAQLTVSIEALTRAINERLEVISGHVRERLDEGFRKTNETFANVMARLATIDEAQKKIDGLTSNVVSLQELLGDKRARGAFGEVQLAALVQNALPPDAWELQATLPNGTRVDCLLKLPEPSGQVAVDAKFPLENYHRMLDSTLAESERRTAQSAFRGDIKRHVDAIATKYILPGVTSDGAVMFLPAEAVFAEIHAYHPEIVAYAQSRRVWIVSPTTLMAVLNTARAVLKDIETRKQVHVIKDALGKLAKDFGRFDERMSALARHIEQANKDAQEVQVSSRKISAHFNKIEAARLDELPDAHERLEE